MGNTRNTGYLQNAIKVSDAGAITFVSGSTTLATLNTSGQLSGSSPVLFASTASFVALAQSASNAVSAQTASFANTLTVAGNLTAQTLVVQTITSSVDFVTGSTRFGSLSTNTHTFTGSVLVTGSLAIGSGSFPQTFAVKISGSSYNGTNVWFQDGSATDGMSFGGNGANSFKTINTYGGALHLNSVSQNGVNMFGNVGIGKSNPSEIFDVNTGQGARGGMALTGEYPYLRFNVSSSSANARNWALNATNAEAGDFAILQSNAKDGNPVTAGTSILGFSRGGAATFSSFIQATGLYGKSYPQTSTSGNVSIVDTGIYNSIDYSSGMIWLVSYGGNPLAAGSNYFANYLGALSVTTGYIGGSVKQYIQYSPISQFDASGVGALSLTAVFWNGTTELTTIPNSNTSYQIRLKIGTYNPVGAGQYVYLLKMG